MPNFSTFGIYSGGEVTKGPGSVINISPFMIHGFSGRLAGMGSSFPNAAAKQIPVYFGGTPGGNVAGDNTMSPSYKISTGSSSGSTYIFYDESKNDIAFSPTPLSNVAAFAKVSWTLPLNMNNVTIDTSYVSSGNPNRMESNVAAVVDPQSAENFHYDGQKFRSGAVNRPLANMSVVMEAMQEESLSSLGSTFFITLINQGHIYKNGNDLGLAPCRHIGREGNFAYRVYNSKYHDQYGVTPQLAVKRTFNLSQVNGDNVYIVIERTSGQLGIFLATAEQSQYNLNTTHFLLARSISAASGNTLTGITDMNQIQFEIVNNLAGINSLKDKLSDYIRQDVSGLFNPIKVLGDSAANSIFVPQLYGHIQGNAFVSYASILNLGTAPTSGPRQDFVFLQVTKKFNPDIIINTELRVVPNIDINAYPEYFNNPAVKALLDNNTLGASFIKQPDGSYKSTGNSGTSEYFAIPIAVVNRFNSSAYSIGNVNGAAPGSRPDGKVYNYIKTKEIQTCAPIINRRAISELLDETVSLIMLGSLNSSFSNTNGNNNSFSLEPLQTDYLGSYSIGNKMGDMDGARRFWTGSSENNIRMGFATKWNTSFTYPYANFSFNVSTGQSVIDLRVPASYQDDMTILTDAGGQPLNVSLLWKSDMTAVKLKSAWEPAYNNSGEMVILCTNEIDTTDASYQAKAINNEEIVVAFSVNYVKAHVFSKPVKEFVRIQRNGNVGKDNHYAHVKQISGNTATIMQLPRTNVINTVTYTDNLKLNKSLSTVKGHVYELTYHVLGTNLTSTAYNIPNIHTLTAPDMAGSYRALSVIEVLDKNNQAIGIRDIVYIPNTNSFDVYLTQAIPNDEPVKFILGLDGDQIDISYGSLGIKNIVRSESASINTGAGAVIPPYRYFDSVNNIGGHIFTGISSFRGKYSVFAESPTSGVGYVQVPIKAEGFGGNILQFNAVINTDEYNALSTLQKACYIAVGSNYRIRSNTNMIFSVTRGLNESNSIVASYTYGASPFKPIDINKTYKLLDPGFLIFTTDGSGNDNDGVYSPLVEKFPVVQGLLGSVGSGSAAETGLTSSINIHQTGLRVSAGQNITFDGEMGFGVFIQQNRGQAVYVSLVKESEKILGFIYVQSLGQMIFNNPAQAFVFELNDYLRG